MPERADILIEMLHLQPHPEGGCFRETYRSSGTIARHGPYDGPRSYSTAILFLLKAGQCSKLHRIRSDELWHFHLGDALEILSIDAAGTLTRTVLGADLGRGEQLQAMVPAGSWFGARPVSTREGFSLVGCTVAPGFAFQDFELAKRETLTGLYPQHREAIEALT